MATTSAAGALGSSIPVSVNTRYIYEIRDYALMIGLMAVFDREGMPGVSEQISRITNSFSPGDPVASISNGATEGNAVSDTDLTQDSVTITSNARAASIVLTKVAEQAGAVNWPDAIRKLLSRSTADYVDKIAMALFSSITNGNGATGTSMTLGTYRAAQTNYRNNAKQFAGKGNALFHPNCWGQLMDELLSGGGASLAQILNKVGAAEVFGGEAGSGMLQAYKGHLLGMPCWDSTNVPLSGSDRYNAIITGRNPTDAEDPMCSIGMRTAWAPNLSDHDLRVNAQLARRFMVDMSFGVGLLNANLSYYMLAKT